MPQKAAPKLTVAPVDAAATPTDAAGMKIGVARLNIAGSRVYAESVLLQEAGFVPGSQLSLAELRAMAAKIAAFYHRNGYFLAQAFLPAQDIKDGVVTIAVHDGRYGKITLRNASGVADTLANDLLGGLETGAIVAVGPLEHRLLLLSDLPGVQVKSSLVPGESSGASDLIVDLAQGPRVSGSVDADNAGNRYTGKGRVGATVNLNELAGQGDVATLRLLTSGSGLKYARLSYQAQVGKLKAGVAYSALEYELGREFEPLGAHGTAKIATVYGNYPLVRARNTNVYGQLSFDAKRFNDQVDITQSASDKTARVLSASLYGDHRDNVGGGGLNTFGLTWSTGEVDLQTPSLRAFDAASAGSNGHYNKLGYNAARLQNVTDTVALYAAINGQVASKNLDVSEKMELGGMYGVRAYPEGEAYADQGYVLNLEARLALSARMQLVGFVDQGSVTTNKHAWTNGANRRTLSAAGVGLSWSDPASDIGIKAYYAHKLGNDKALSAPDAAGRFWVQAVKYF